MDELINRIAAEMAREIAAQTLEIVRSEIERIAKSGVEIAFTEAEAAGKLRISKPALFKLRKEGLINYTPLIAKSGLPGSREVPGYSLNNLLEYLARNEVRQVFAKKENVVAGNFKRTA